MAHQVHRVVVTGIGMVNPEPLAALLKGAPADPSASPPEITAFELPDGAPAWGYEILDVNLEQELPNIKSFIDRASGLALVAGKRALADAGLLEADKRPAGTEIGCAYGTLFGCLEAMGIFWNKVKTSNPKFAQPLPFTQGYANSPSSLLCIEYGLRGPAATFSGEKLAGLEALVFAFDQIAAGSGNVIMAGASEALTQSAYNHLLAEKQLSRSGRWDDGLLPAEGACMLVLENAEHAKARGARIYAEVDGINFFHVEPKSPVAPIQVATGRDETVIFAAAPTVGPTGGWQQPLVGTALPAVLPKLHAGDSFAVAPVLAAALGAGAIKGTVPLALAAGQPGLPVQNAPELKVKHAIAAGYDPAGSLGLVVLREY